MEQREMEEAATKYRENQEKKKAAAAAQKVCHRSLLIVILQVLTHSEQVIDSDAAAVSDDGENITVKSSANPSMTVSGYAEVKSSMPVAPPSMSKKQQKMRAVEADDDSSLSSLNSATPEPQHGQEPSPLDDLNALGKSVESDFEMIDAVSFLAMSHTTLHVSLTTHRHKKRMKMLMKVQSTTMSTSRTTMTSLSRTRTSTLSLSPQMIPSMQSSRFHQMDP